MATVHDSPSHAAIKSSGSAKQSGPVSPKEQQPTSDFSVQVKLRKRRSREAGKSPPPPPRRRQLVPPGMKRTLRLRGKRRRRLGTVSLWWMTCRPWRWCYRSSEGYRRSWWLWCRRRRWCYRRRQVSAARGVRRVVRCSGAIGRRSIRPARDASTRARPLFPSARARVFGIGLAGTP